jgi:hypothetical protein
VNLGDWAGYSAIAAIVALIISGVTIALFFGGAGSFWGPVNDVFTALTAILLILPILAVLRLAPDDIGPWFGVLSVAATLGALLIAVGQLLLVAGVISLDSSFLTGGIGVLPFLLWLVGLAYLVLTRDVMSVVVGYLIGGVLVAAALTTVSALLLPWPVTTAFSVALLALLVAWLGLLAGEVRTAV